MSNHLAIAAATSTIRDLLLAALSSDAELAGATVTVRPPDRARLADATVNQLNLFLCRISLAGVQQNQNQPGRVPVALVLSYLMTAYGAGDDDILAHRLLGAGMQTLKDQPVLSVGSIAAALPGSGLEQQGDQVRITLNPVPLDVMAAMWAAFGAGYRMSVIYDVGVVLID